MAHLDDATALAYAAGALAGEAFEAALAHVDACADCRRMIAGAVHTAAAPVEPGVAAPPAAIGRFTVEGVAGHGAMGVVYRARDPRLDRPVALKMMRGDAFAGDSRARFEREARALARIDHPNVVRVYEVGEHEGALYLAMELVAGTTVLAWLAEALRQPADVVAVFAQAAEGLLAAHQAGLVHRDFKPANAMIDAEGRVRVTDFGLVHLDADPPRVPAASDGAPAADALTRTGALLGTPAYLAPELLAAALDGSPSAAGAGPEPRSDQFSFCVALYEALAGHRPFAAGDLRGLRAAIEAGPMPPRRPIPRRVHRALRRGLALAPRDRFPSMRELIDAVAPPPRRRQRIALAIAGAAIVAVAAVVWTRARPAAMPAGGGCPTAAARWAATWTAARKQAVRDAVVRAWPAAPPPGTAPALAARWDGLARVRATLVVDGVRRFGDAWQAQYADVCTGAAAETRLRRACLDDVVGRLDALVATPLGGALADELRALDDERVRCATHLVASLDLPAAAVAPLVDAARADLARAGGLRVRGDLEQAAATAERAIAAGTRAGSPSLLAEAWLERGLIARDARQIEASLDAWHTALGFAQQVGHRRVLRRTADELAAQYALGVRDPALAERWLRTAETLDGTVPPSDGERALRLYARAELAHAAGADDEARRLLDQALPLAGGPGAPLATRIARTRAALPAP